MTLLDQDVETPPRYFKPGRTACRVASPPDKPRGPWRNTVAGLTPSPFTAVASLETPPHWAAAPWFRLSVPARLVGVSLVPP